MSLASGASPILGACVYSDADAVPTVKTAAAKAMTTDFMRSSPVIPSILALFAPVPRQEALHRPVHRGFDAEAEGGEQQHRDECLVVMEGPRIEQDVEAEPFERDVE